MNKEKELIGYISAIQTLVDNFPLSLLEYLASKGKRYNSVLDFILDIIFLIWGNDIDRLYNTIVDAIFGVQMSMITKTAEGLDAIDDDVLESKTFNKLEDVVKGAVVSILTAILSCSAVPEIPTENMDKSKEHAANNSRERGGFGPTKISIPISFLDIFNKLSINPCHKVGKTFYDLGTTHYAPSELYKSHDFDAFLWYVLYKGVAVSDNSNISYSEENKMMWDNRREMKYDDEYAREAMAARWTYWLNSKKSETGTLHCEGDAYNGNPDYSGTKYYPILQLEPNAGGAVPQIDILFPAQRYYNYKKNSGSDIPYPIYNHTMYKFNVEFVNSIRIFSVRVILANLLNSLTNGFLDTLQSNPVSFGLNANYVVEQMSNIVKNMVMQDDMSIEDCVFTFSNEDYDRMMNETELRRYGIQAYNEQSGEAVQYNQELIESSINELNGTPSDVANNKTIQRAIYNVSATAQTNPELAIKLGVSVNMTGIIENLIMSLIMPIVRSLLSPKVMMLFLLNFQVSGLLDMEKIMKGDAYEILNIIYTKIFSILKQVVLYIKDLIVTILTDIFEKEIKPLINSFMLILLLERIDSWIKLLEEALQCIPIFNINLPKAKYAIDNVNYADIEQPQNKPEKDSNC